MELWGLVKRLLAGATPGQAFNPGLVMGSFLCELERNPDDYGTTRDQMDKDAEELAEQLVELGLIQAGHGQSASATLANEMVRTAFGEELYQALQGRNVVMLFESMMVDLTPGAIRRVLHQLNS